MTRQVSPFFDRVARGQLRVTWLDADTAGPTKRLMVLGIWLFALAMAYPYLPGSGTEAFQGISVLLGLMVTFGGSSLFAQGASGLILMYSRTLRVGEYVRIDQHEGTVTESGELHHARSHGTRRGDHAAECAGPGHRGQELLTHGAGAGLHRRHNGHNRLRHAVAAGGGDAARSGAPDARRAVFAHRRACSRRRCRTSTRNTGSSCQAIPREARPRAEVLTTLHANIQDVFNEHGVQIMSPHYLGDPRGPKVVAKADWYTAPAKPPETA